MKPVCRLFLLLFLALLTGAVQAAAPVVTNVRSAQRAGTRLVDISYDLADADSASLTVSVSVSTNGGASYQPTGASCTGAVGAGVAPGSNRKITWDAGVDLPAQLFSAVRVSVTAADDPVPGGMALIPAGAFVMGNALSASGDGSSFELPTHSVQVSAFYLDKYEVTKALWDEVYQWATNQGYSFESGSFGLGKAANHPVHTVSWYDCVKWCNARSEKENRVPAYYTSAAQTTVYRTGQMDVSSAAVRWTAGYRLPTEAEWEKAARGGAAGRRFPWADADTITHSRANCFSESYHFYDTSPTRGFHPTFATGTFPYTSPAGFFAPNGYGLYDMAGNVSEWCWDWYGGYSATSQTDPRGPTSGSRRMIRGGSGENTTDALRCALRSHDTPSIRYNFRGFRCVLAACRT